jgi:hypothetical protein
MNLINDRKSYKMQKWESSCNRERMCYHDVFTLEISPSEREHRDLSFLVGRKTHGKKPRRRDSVP